VQLQISQATNAAEAATFGWRIGVVVLLFIVYSALAIWQWRRVEA
jgi:DNA-binding transcriptional regulator of glucitol operon